MFIDRRSLTASEINFIRRRDYLILKPPAAAKSLQSCLTLCDPIHGSPPGFPVPGILQVRTLEWAAIFVSNAWKWKVKGKSLSPIRLFVTPWTAAYQAPPSMGFSRQEYWSGVPLPSPFKASRLHKMFNFESDYYCIPLKEMTTHSSILAWRIPWTEEPGRLQSMVLRQSDTA